MPVRDPRVPAASASRGGRGRGGECSQAPRGRVCRGARAGAGRRSHQRPHDDRERIAASDRRFCAGVARTRYADRADPERLDRDRGRRRHRADDSLRACVGLLAAGSRRGRDHRHHGRARAHRRADRTQRLEPGRALGTGGAERRPRRRCGRGGVARRRGGAAAHRHHRHPGRHPGHPVEGDLPRARAHQRHRAGDPHPVAERHHRGGRRRGARPPLLRRRGRGAPAGATFTRIGRVGSSAARRVCGVDPGDRRGDRRGW